MRARSRRDRECGVAPTEELMRGSMKRAAWALGAALALAGLGCSSGGGDVAFVPSFLVSDVRIDTDFAGEATSDSMRACSDGLTVYAVWRDFRNGSSDIYFSKSADGGATWLPTDVRLDTDAAGESSSDDPQITCEGQNLYVVWEDDRDDGKDIRFQRSTDGGDTWLAADVRLDLDLPGAAASGDAFVAAGGTNVYVIWEEERDGQRDVYFRGSTDSGATFGPEMLLNTNGAGASLSDRPRISASGANVAVVWHDNRNGSLDIFANVSRDGGATWLASDVRLDTDAAGAAQSSDPEVEMDGARVFVAWSDFRDGSADIRTNRSLDGGTTWLATDVRVDTDVAGADTSIRPQVRCSGNYVYVTWIDRRDGNGDVRFNRSTDQGASFGAADARLDTDAAGVATSDFVKLAAQGPNVYVVWQDNRDGSNDVRFSVSTDRGASFLAADLQMDTHLAGAADSVFPQITNDGVNVYVLWSDRRDGNSDIYIRPSTQQ